MIFTHLLVLTRSLVMGQHGPRLRSATQIYGSWEVVQLMI